MPHGSSGRFGFVRAVAFVSLVLLAAGDLQPAHGALKIRKGDLVDVQVRGKWQEVKVIDLNRREVLVEYEFAGRPRRATFKRSAIRQKYEIGALSKLRAWFDAKGTRMYSAVLISSDGTNVTLRKEDLSETKVPIKELRDSDQALVERLTKAGSAGSGGVPMAPADIAVQPRFPDAVPQPNHFFSSRKAITPDPLVNTLEIKQGGTAFAKKEIFEDIAAVIPVGGPESLVLAATRSSFEKPGRLIWISTANNVAKQQQILPGMEVVLDYHLSTNRLLTQATRGVGSSKKSTLTLWEVRPTDVTIRPIIRWDVTSSSWSSAPGNLWGRIVDGDIVVHRAQKSQFVGWDTANKKVKYKIVQESFFEQNVAVSPGGKQLFVSNDKSMRVFDTRTGELLSTMPAPEGVTGIAISKDGVRAATLGRNKLTVWDLTSATAKPQVYQAESIGSPFGSQISWIGEDRLLASRNTTGMSLFSLKHKLTLWTYETEKANIAERGKRAREVVANHLVYAASVREGTTSGFAVGAASLPGPKVDELTANLDPDSLMLMKPGSEVRLEVSTGQYDAQVRAAMVKAIAATGWKQSASASVTLKAVMRRGKSQTVTYSFSGRNMPDQTVTTTPHIAEVKLMVGDVVAWQSGNSNGGAPGMIMLREGQSAQAEVNQYSKPNPGFFGTVKIPVRISDPAKRNGLGTTKVTNRGLVVE